MKKSKRAVAALSALLVVGVGSVAYADNVIVDGDGLTPIIAQSMNLTLSCDGTASKDALLAITRQGQGQVFGDDGTATVAVTAMTGDGLTAVMGVPATIGLPEDWEDSANNRQVGSAKSTVSVTSTTAGSGSITYTATGPSATTGSLSRSTTLPVTWTAPATCANEAPTAPGKPTSSTYLTKDGGHTLSWAASTDAEDDGFNYLLEGKASNGAWTSIAGGLTTNSHTFGAGEPAEGTWIYRVTAVETKVQSPKSSEPSPSSDAVVVDRSAPYAPTASADHAPEYTDGAGVNWWKSSVTVSFNDNGDPALADGSAGSGVDSTTEPRTYSSTGSFTAEGTSTDHAGNESLEGSLSGSVDATPPVVTVTPGPAQVKLGSTATVDWTASDVGSGLKTAASGSTSLDTGSVGPKTVTLPVTAEDNVGNKSVPVTYTYSVVYDFTGFFQPIDMGKANVAKAGSAIPVKFSLGGDQGLNVFRDEARFFPTGGAVTGDEVEQYVAATNSSLSYDPVANQYVYVWKTNKDWAGRSGELRVYLADGTTQIVQMSFRK